MSGRSEAVRGCEDALREVSRAQEAVRAQDASHSQRTDALYMELTEAARARKVCLRGVTKKYKPKPFINPVP